MKMICFCAFWWWWWLKSSPSDVHNNKCSPRQIYRWLNMNIKPLLSRWNTLLVLLRVIMMTTMIGYKSRRYLSNFLTKSSCCDLQSLTFKLHKEFLWPRIISLASAHPSSCLYHLKVLWWPSGILILKKWLNRFLSTLPCAIHPIGIKTPLYFHLLLIAMERHQVATDPSQLSWTSILRSSRVSEVTEPLGIIRNRRRSLKIHQTSLDRLWQNWSH